MANVRVERVFYTRPHHTNSWI